MTAVYIVRINFQATGVTRTDPPDEYEMQKAVKDFMEDKIRRQRGDGSGYFDEDNITVIRMNP